MLTDTTLRAAVEALWDKLWSGGLSNPLDAIEQLSFLPFLKRLEEREQDGERSARLRSKKFTPIFTGPDLRWSYWTQLPADKALKHVKELVFPFIKALGGAGGSFAPLAADLVEIDPGNGSATAKRFRLDEPLAIEGRK